MSADLHERERTDPEPSRARPRWVVIASWLVPVVAFAVLLASGLGRNPRELPSELVGDPAPAFTLPLLDGGGTIDLDSLRGQVVVLNFWASWCVPCREEHPALLEAWGRYRERGVVIVGVNFEDAEASALEYAAEMGGDWPLATDPGSRTAIDYGVFGIPETFVIAPDGTVTAKTTGRVTYGWLEDEIESALRTEARR